MALQPGPTRSSVIAFRYGALSSLIPASVYLILFLLNLLIHNLDQTEGYVVNIIPFPTLFTTETFGDFYLQNLIFFCYEGFAFAVVVAIAAGMSGRWAREQTGKVSTALLQGLWAGCGFGIIATLIKTIPALLLIVTGQDKYGMTQSALLFKLSYFLIYCLVVSLLAILFGMLGGWLGCKFPRKQPVTSPIATSTPTN